jgi:hypothetical protein
MLPITFRSELHLTPAAPHVVLMGETVPDLNPHTSPSVPRRDRPTKNSIKYHGAGPLLNEVRGIIAATTVGEKRLMSAGIMVKLLQERGAVVLSALSLYLTHTHSLYGVLFFEISPLGLTFDISE